MAAGKTTLIDALTGFAQASGTLALGDLGMESLPAYKRARAGLGRTFQSIELYGRLERRGERERRTGGRRIAPRAALGADTCRDARSRNTSAFQVNAERELRSNQPGGQHLPTRRQLNIVFKVDARPRWSGPVCASDWPAGLALIVRQESCSASCA